MGTARPIESFTNPARKWSVSAGFYMFICGTVVALLLSDILVLLAEVIGLPTDYSMVILASPAFVVGAVLWWTAIERRNSYTYSLGGAFGFVTALFTGLLWTAQFIRFWGVEMAEIPMVGFLIVFVLAITATAGAIVAIPLMYVRRRLNSEPPGRTGPEM